jgi:hypothetical protein
VSGSQTRVRHREGELCTRSKWEKQQRTQRSIDLLSHLPSLHRSSLSYLSFHISTGSLIPSCPSMIPQLEVQLCLSETVPITTRAIRTNGKTPFSLMRNKCYVLSVCFFVLFICCSSIDSSYFVFVLVLCLFPVSKFVLVWLFLSYFFHSLFPRYKYLEPSHTAIFYTYFLFPWFPSFPTPKPQDTQFLILTPFKYY